MLHYIITVESRPKTSPRTQSTIYQDPEPFPYYIFDRNTTISWKSIYKMTTHSLIYVKYMIFLMPPKQISLCRTVEKDRNLERKSQLETLDEDKIARSNTPECTPYTFLVRIFDHATRIVTTHNRRDPLDRQFVFPSNSSSDVA